MARAMTLAAALAGLLAGCGGEPGPRPTNRPIPPRLSAAQALDREAQSLGAIPFTTPAEEIARPLLAEGRAPPAGVRTVATEVPPGEPPLLRLEAEGTPEQLVEVLRWALEQHPYAADRIEAARVREGLWTMTARIEPVGYTPGATGAAAQAELDELRAYRERRATARRAVENAFATRPPPTSIRVYAP